MAPHADLIIRSTGLLFTRGRRVTDLCEFELTFDLSPSGEIFHISKEDVWDRKGRVRVENFFIDPLLTEGWKFAEALELVKSTLNPIIGKTGEHLTDLDPLLNRRPKTIRTRDGGDLGQDFSR